LASSGEILHGRVEFLQEKRKGRTSGVRWQNILEGGRREERDSERYMAYNNVRHTIHRG